MSKLVELRLEGNLEQGVITYLEMEEEEKRLLTDSGELLPAPELAKFHTDWRNSYRNLDGRNRIKFIPGQITNVSLKQLRLECQEKAEQLQQSFNNWLAGESFRPLREKLLHQLTPKEEVRVVVRSASRQILSLPWHQWDLVESYPNREIAIGAHKSESPYRKPSFRTGVRILAILGNSLGINVEEDRRLLEELPGAEIQFLDEPQRKQINDQLWEQHWDILFFAGHSRTEEHRGHLEINATESLTIEDLKYGLKKAIAGGLQLAIFNSCDGLGLAWELQKLQIPQVIVMGEPVPDHVAQEFLKYFLIPFAEGQPFYLAVRGARERLQGLEDEFPCASWLPVICQNPLVKPPTWLALTGFVPPTDINRAWQDLRDKAEPTDKIWSENVKRDLVPPLKEIRLGSRIRLAMELDRQEGYLIVLDKGTSGKVYCLCPSSGFAPNPKFKQGVTFYLPQEGARLPYFSVAGSEGQEEVLAIITDTPLDLEWLRVDSKTYALELTLEHLIQLLVQLNQRSDWRAIRTDFNVL